MPKVTSPVLVIHGTKDEVIDYSHGEAIYERCPRAVAPLWVQVSVLKPLFFYLEKGRGCLFFIDPVETTDNAFKLD